MGIDLIRIFLVIIVAFVIFAIHRFIANRNTFIRESWLAIPLTLMVIGSVLSVFDSIGLAIIGAGGYALALQFSMWMAVRKYDDK